MAERNIDPSYDYPSNSNKDNDEKIKKVDKIVSGKTKKKTGISKITNAFISEDASNVKSYILMDVLIPAIKKAVSDIITNGIEMLLYGETGSSRKKSRSDRISYSSYYERDRDRHDYSRVRSTYEYDDIVVDSRADAQRVLDKMDEILEEYGTVSVGDFYDLIGVTGRYTDYKYGWTDLRLSRVERVRDGYLIKLPKAVPLD